MGENLAPLAAMTPAEFLPRYQQLMSAHACEVGFSQKKLAAKLGISSSILRYYISRAGHQFTADRAQLRRQRALQLIGTGLTLEQIAPLCGMLDKKHLYPLLPEYPNLGASNRAANIANGFTTELHRHLRAHYTEQGFGLPQLAALMGRTSPSGLSLAISKRTGKSFSQHLHELRASQLLQLIDLGVHPQTASEQVGLHSHTVYKHIQRPRQRQLKRQLANWLRLIPTSADSAAERRARTASNGYRRSTYQPAEHRLAL